MDAVPTKETEADLCVSASGRLDYLDSLRGLAALAVALNHCWLSFPLPAHALVAGILGKLPVLFFFLLSGFVLGKSLQRESLLGRDMIFRFYIKRFFRLYPPIFCVVLISLILVRYLSVHGNSLDLSDWGLTMIQGQQTAALWPNFLKEFYLFQYDLNPSMWSLAVEFPCSLLLPFIHILYERHRKWVIPTLLFSAGFMLVDGAIINLLSRPDHSPLLDFTRYTQYSFAWSISPLKFMFTFFLGYLISRKSDMLELIQTVRPYRVLVAAMIVISGVYVLLFADKKTVGNVGAALILGMVFIFVVYLAGIRVKSFLMLRPIHFMGKISYSFYLIHFPMLMLTISILQKAKPMVSFELPTIAYFVVSTVISLFFAISAGAFLEKNIEKPVNMIGHKLSSLIS